jgi:hypothetical protein
MFGYFVYRMIMNYSEQGILTVTRTISFAKAKAYILFIPRRITEKWNNSNSVQRPHGGV